jgi:sugar-specific transcriptional regulator TrmB
MSDTSIQRQLIEFGLTDLEVRIYLYLLKSGSQTILEIARGLNIPRTSVYDNSLKLSEKGLVERELGYKTQKLSASPIQLFSTIIDKEK